MAFLLSLILAGIGTGCISSLPGLGTVLQSKATGTFNFPTHGTRIRAVVDRRELSELAAINANRVASLSWAMGAGLAGLTGVLLAPEGLDPIRLTLLVIETFSVAVVARLVSIPMAVAA